MADVNIYTLTKTGDSNTYHFRDDSKGEANGIASLDNTGKVPSSQLPTIPAAQIQSNWTQSDNTKLDYIKNKPTLGTAAAKDIPATGNASTSQVVMGNDTRLSDSRPASDVYDWAKASTKPTYTKSEVGLSNVDNTSDATKKSNFTGSIASSNTGFVTGGDAYTAFNGKLSTSLKGAANGLAELDSTGKVPSSQLPSFVDDVIEVDDYAHLPITGESGKIYVTKDTNKTYRWTGTAYVEISESLALGETSSTAYRGDRGKTAYDHASETKLSTATSSGLYKVAATKEGHVASLTAVQKSDITALGIPGSDTNTTYTFEGGTNSFKVTPSGGTAQTVTVTPSITNNVTGSGTSGYLTKFNGANTITDGPALGSDTTKFLRNDGSWVTPTGTTYTAGIGLQLVGTQFLTYVPRISSGDANYKPGNNKFYMQEYSTNSTNIPESKWQHILTTQGSDGNYSTQLTLGMTGVPAAYYRRMDSNNYSEWYRITNAVLQRYETGTITANGTWYRLFKVTYNTYNYLHMRVIVKSGYDNLFEAFICVRYTPNGMESNSTNMRVLSTSGKDLVLYQIDDNTIALAVKAWGTTSIMGFEIHDINSEGNNIKADSITVENPFVALSAKPAEFGNHRYITGNYADINGTPSLNFLPLSGGTITGQLSFGQSSLPEFSGNPPYLLGIESYSSGGAVKWKAPSNVTVGAATKATQDSDGNAINTTYLKKSGGTMTGQLYLAGSASSKPLKTRGIIGVTTDGTSEEALYLQYGNTNLDTVYFGNAGGGNINTNGTQYSGNAATATKATQDSDGNAINTTYLKKSGGTITGALALNGDLQLKPASSSSNDSPDIVWYYGNGQEKARLWTADTYSAASGLTYRLYKSDGTLLHSSTIPLSDTKNTAGSTDTSSKIFLIGATSQAANPQTYSDDQVYVTSGTLQTNITKAATIVNANSAGSGTAGGLALYSDASPEQYGIMFRNTSNQGKHGYVQSDWATYLTMSNTDNRGWVFRRNSSGNVASIDTAGRAVFNGSVTVGGNAANTSGARMVYDSTSKAINFEFL